MERKAGRVSVRSLGSPTSDRWMLLQPTPKDTVSNQAGQVPSLPSETASAFLNALTLLLAQGESGSYRPKWQSY